MFRKIHSNRAPQDTVLNQLRAEFKPYFERCSNKITQTLESHHKISFALMIVLIILSAGLCFTVFRNKEPAENSRITLKANKVNAVSDGFSQILSTAANIKQGIALKHQIDSLSLKKSLTKTDSQTLINELDKLRQLNKPSQR